MINCTSGVNFTSQQKVAEAPKRSKFNVGKTILATGLGGTALYSALRHTLFVYPKSYKYLKYGVPAAGVALIGYGVYDAIKNKNKLKSAEPGTKKDYAKAMAAGSIVAATAFPLHQCISSSLISARFSKSIKDFVNLFKLLLPQMKLYTQAMYGHMLSKIGIKNLSANKTLLLGTVALVGAGALVGAAVQGVNDLIIKFKNKKSA